MARRINRQAPQDDLFAALAPLLKVQPVLEDVCYFGGAWRAEHDASGTGQAQFHIVLSGNCRIERPAEAPLNLRAGDVLLLPHGDRHAVASRKAGARQALTVAVHNAIRTKSTADAAPDTALLCGRLIFEAGEDNVLTSALPDSIVIRTLARKDMEQFRSLLEIIKDELDSQAPGVLVIASHLATAFFTTMLRHHLQQTPQSGSALSLLRDRGTARVMLTLLRAPARDWTLDELAQLAVTSRATFVRTFKKASGFTPMTYLTHLRLDLARQRLAGTNDTVADIAEAVGYLSEAALSRAFFRRFGIRPGALRAR